MKKRVPINTGSGCFSAIRRFISVSLTPVQQSFPIPSLVTGQVHLCVTGTLPAKSLTNHWEGLTRFVTNPGIPMDNNAAEQAIRTGVLGRKNYYGSGNDWSEELAAFLFSVFMTLKIWDINPNNHERKIPFSSPMVMKKIFFRAKIWMSAYLDACAENDRKPPEDLAPYLPWLMSEDRLCEMRNHDPPRS